MTTYHRTGPCSWRITVAELDAGHIEHTHHRGGTYRTTAYDPAGAYVGNYISDGAAVAELERRHRAAHPHPGPFALALTHPDGSHTLEEHPDAVTAHHVAGIAVHRNRDAVAALIIDPAGHTVAELHDKDPR